ncbi:DUF3023 domain-containing protein [Ehrlichia canis]|uniref:Uncharacterized protein n=1 Tax=Ehrlichia canis (strain Jake) TaxID=269484 RepID=A0ACA6AVT4_EHRCJ|nr:DUF3023 domain-containing protein [Ehrlichia canis]AAZ68472.1 hypothetical protein Ecaj_0430 [Ehrlichia canis str. Jake]
MSKVKIDPNIYCIGNTVESTNRLQVHVSNKRHNRTQVQPIGNSLFLLKARFPSGLVKNDSHLRSIYALSNKEKEELSIAANLYCLVKKDALAEFNILKEKILNKEQKYINYFINYGNIVFANLTIDSNPKSQYNEHFALQNIAQLDADFIVEQEQNTTLSIPKSRMRIGKLDTIEEENSNLLT